MQTWLTKPPTRKETDMDEVGQTIYKCDLCGKNFVFGNDEDDIPNGIQFNFTDGSTHTLCKACISCRYQDAIKLIDDRFAKSVYPAAIKLIDDSEFFLRGYGGTMSTQNN